MSKAWTKMFTPGSGEYLPDVIEKGDPDKGLQPLDPFPPGDDTIGPIERDLGTQFGALCQIQQLPPPPTRPLGDADLTLSDVSRGFQIRLGGPGGVLRCRGGGYISEWQPAR